MNVDELYTETNKRINKRLKNDASILVLQKRQVDLGKRMNKIAMAIQKRIEIVAAEEIKRSMKQLVDR